MANFFSTGPMLSSQTPSFFLISNFRRVLYVVCFLLGNSPIIYLLAYEDGIDSVPKLRHIKFRRRLHVS
jgi:hypothetical protein